MMKKVLLLNLLSLAVVLGFAQTQVGQTRYDLQTNSAVCRRVAMTSTGEIVISYTKSNNTAFDDRGSGTNYFNGTSWATTSFGGTFVRPEVDRTGWPSSVITRSGKEVIVSHFADPTNTSYENGLSVISRNVGTTAWTSTFLPTSEGGSAVDATWARLANSGDSLALIVSTFDGTYNNVDGGLMFYRSFDQGATWIGSDTLDFVNTSYVARIGGDNYAIDANDNGTIAIVYGNYATKMIKSTDFGNTWTYTLVNPTYDFSGNLNPDNFSGAIGEEMDTAYVSDGSYSIVVDDNDDVHVWYGVQYSYKDDPSTEGVFYFPALSDGIAYWNESMSEPKRLDATRFVAEQIELGFPGMFSTASTYDNQVQPDLYSSGYTSMASGGYDEFGNLYFAYAALRSQEFDLVTGDEINGISPSSVLYNDIFLMKSEDGGATWIGPYNVTNERNRECVYPGIPRKIYGTSVPIIWQEDDLPGTNLQVPTGYNHNIVINEINFLAVPVADIVNPADITFPTLEGPAAFTVEVLEGCDPNFVLDEILNYIVIDDVPQGNDTDMLSSDVPPSFAVGSQILNIFLVDDAGNASADTLQLTLIVTADNTPPTVTLVGLDTLAVLINGTYSDPGVTFTDNGCDIVAAPVSVDNVSPNLATPGFYTYTYTVTDNAGNSTTVTRYVEVLASDATAPVITLNGANTMTIEACTGFTDPGATAFDNVDFSVPAVPSGSVNDNLTGIYTITYTATDLSGNVSTSTLTVNVVDNTAPTLQILNDPTTATVNSTTYLYQGDAFVSPPTSAQDPNCNSQVITVSYDDSGLNSAVIGSYTVVYTATDPAGNSTTQNLNVIVGREPQADWQVANQAGLSFSFQDISLYSPNKWTWNFGDGSNLSPQPNPNKIYAAVGTYNVCLKAENRFNLAPFNKTASETCRDLEITVGILDAKILDAAVSIYPNPTSGLVNVEISETGASNLTVEITNLLGEVIATKEIAQVNGTEVVSFDLQHNASGIYFVNISSNNASISKRLMIK